MAKINLEKFICDFIYHRDRDNGNICDIIDMALKDQGFEYVDRQIVEIQKPEEELTEFERAVVIFAMYFTEDRQKPKNEWQDEVVMIKNNVNYMLSLARKQIAEEVPVDDMCERFLMNLNNRASLQDIYKKGILDTLEKIKGGKIL